MNKSLILVNRSNQLIDVQHELNGHSQTRIDITQLYQFVIIKKKTALIAAILDLRKNLTNQLKSI